MSTLFQPFTPSAIPFGANLPKEPREMTEDDIARVRETFAHPTYYALN